MDMDKLNKPLQRGEKVFTVANCLTLFRLFCVPLFLIFFARHDYGFALAIFAAASFTDLVDGTIARYFKQESRLGKLLDPVADKTLMLSVFVCLSYARIVPSPLLFIGAILSRDIVVTLGFLYIKLKKIPFEPYVIPSSKIATFLEIVAGTLGLISLKYPYAYLGSYPIGELVIILLAITAIAILIAALSYVKIGMDVLKKAKA